MENLQFRYYQSAVDVIDVGKTHGTIKLHKEKMRVQEFSQQFISTAVTFNFQQPK
jgi:hypothetical protein